MRRCWRSDSNRQEPKLNRLRICCVYQFRHASTHAAANRGNPKARRDNNARCPGPHGAKYGIGCTVHHQIYATVYRNVVTGVSAKNMDAILISLVRATWTSTPSVPVIPRPRSIQLGTASRGEIRGAEGLRAVRALHGTKGLMGDV